MDNPILGSCLCGAVTFQVDPPFGYFGECYCERCRKKTGSAMAVALIVPANQFAWIEGEDNVRRWDMPEAKSFATSVCSVCGASLPHLTRSGREAIVPAGSLDTQIEMKPSQTEYWEDRASWVGRGVRSQSD